MDEFRRANRELWDEWAAVNARSGLYRLDEFRAGKNKLNALEREEMGEVAGLTLLHLMCHFGMDTLSWARLGAAVTGIDFSPEAIRMARELSDETGVPGRFICSELYELPAHLDETFDRVFSSYGVLAWLPDLPGWARIVARYLKPGGRFYLAEFHPAAMLFDDMVEEPEWRVGYDYFAEGPVRFEINGSYADPAAEVRATHSYEWFYPLGKVVTALTEAGLRLEFLHEHPYTVYRQFPFVTEGEDGLWRLPEGMLRVPLLFSLRAVKEAGAQPGA